MHEEPKFYSYEYPSLEDAVRRVSYNEERHGYACQIFIDDVQVYKSEAKAGSQFRIITKGFQLTIPGYYFPEHEHFVKNVEVKPTEDGLLIKNISCKGILGSHYQWFIFGHYDSDIKIVDCRMINGVLTTTLERDE